MTELLSQAYSRGDLTFKTPSWMRILIRETEDPFRYVPEGKTGGVNVIDLANYNSISFIATDDLGKKNKNKSIRNSWSFRSFRYQRMQPYDCRIIKFYPPNNCLNFSVFLDNSFLFIKSIK